MPNLIRNFVNGMMEKDLDERLIPPGKYRHAENVLILNSETADVGAVNKSYSNKQLTNYDFGENPKCLLGLADETNDLLYYFIVSDSGCFLAEWDHGNQILSIVLGDTRPEGERVLDLKEDFLITGVQKIITEDKNKGLLLFTDDNMQPCCINIERAKSYGINGFTKEDIYLIKKPPRYAPVVTPVYTNDNSNNLEDKFLSFSYRYKYLDGEYSALSSFTNYCFYPNKFDLDFQTMENNGMENIFNALKIDFNTGDKRVTDIQIVFKESNSNALFLIENFNKLEKGFGDNEIKTFVFSNNKIYVALPERELFRAFDNVPLKAKALTLIGNRAIFGNYLEFFDLKDSNGNNIVIDYDLSLVSKEIKGETLSVTINNDGKNIVIDFADNQLKKGSGVSLNLKLKETTYNNGDFEENIYFVLNKDYANAIELATDDDFILFVENTITNLFLQNYDAEEPNDSELSSNTIFNIVSSTATTITINAITLTYTIDDTPTNPSDNPSNTHEEISIWKFETQTNVFFEEIPIKTSLKTIRSYEVGIIYLDEFNRTTTVLTKEYNTIYIPIEYSIYQNKLQVSINHIPPFWADRYKLVVKENRGEYQTIYVNVFYEDGLFRWIKLEGANKDKIKEGDVLVVKSDLGGPLDNLVKVKVLEIKEKTKDFIEGNSNEDGADIIEEEGLYFKIKPVGFDMSFNSNTSRTFERFNRFRYPWRTYTSPSFGEGSPFVSYKLAPGSTVRIFISFVASGNIEYNATYDKRFRVQGSYNSIKEWFEAEVENLGSFGQDYTWNGVNDIGDNITQGHGLADEWNEGSGWGWSDDGNSFFVVPHRKGTASRDIRTTIKFEVLFTEGVLIFETLPKDFNSDIFYETEETFDVVNGEHHGSLQHPIIQNQNINTFAPAIIDLDFFNCYAQGNGVESYRVRDEFNTKFLNIDTRPSAVSIEQYKQVRRFADLTHGEPFIESSNINGLNEFNLAKGNFKELDKQYGSIQITYSRDGDIVVWQEDKVSNILFNKDLLFSPDGNVNLTSISQVLGAQTYYMGDNGIGKNPESLAVNDYQFFYVNSIKGFVNRLSNDGITVIMNGMVDYFRDIFITKPTTKKIGGFDPYHKQYFLSVKNEPNIIFEANCGNTIIKSNTTESLTYLLNLNNLIGDIVLNFNIIGGNATITAIFDGDTYVESNITGEGNITIPRTNINETQVEVTITPVGDDAITYEINNSCPLGFSLKVVEVVLNDIDDSGKTIDNRYKWGQSAFYTTNELFLDSPITRFSQYEGIEGQNRFPQRGSIVRMECYKKNSDTARLDTFKCNRLGYLVTALDFDSSTINDLLDQAIFLNITTESIGLNSYIDYGNFVFDRTNENEVLYLIYDFTDRSPEDQGTITIDNITLVGENNVEIVFSLDFETTSIFYRFRRLGSTNWSIESELETTESPQELFVATGNQDIEFQLFATNEIACNNIIYSNIFVLEYDELEPEP